MSKMLAFSPVLSSAYYSSQLRQTPTLFPNISWLFVSVKWKTKATDMDWTMFGIFTEKQHTFLSRLDKRLNLALLEATSSLETPCFSTSLIFKAWNVLITLKYDRQFFMLNRHKETCLSEWFYNGEYELEMRRFSNLPDFSDLHLTSWNPSDLDLDSCTMFSMHTFTTNTCQIPHIIQVSVAWMIKFQLTIWGIQS